MSIDASKISFSYDCFGYMMYYCGCSIGGAGTDGKGRQMMSNRILHKEQAELGRRNIIAGRGRPDMLRKIEKINKAK